MNKLPHCKKKIILHGLHKLPSKMPTYEDVGSLSTFASKSVRQSKNKKSYLQQKINKLSNERRQYSVRKLSKTSYLEKVAIKLSATFATAWLPIRILVVLLIISMAIIDTVVSLIGSCKSYLMNKINDDHPDIVFLSYYSKGNKVQYNCLASLNNEKMSCDNLSYWWVSNKKPNFDDINSLEKISNNHEIYDFKKLSNDYYFNACPSVAFYFEMNQFNEVLSKVAVTLKEEEEQRYRFESCNHAMGIAIKKRQDNIIIRYYNPNDTLRQKTIIVSSEDDLKMLNCNDFMSSELENVFFPDDYKIGCLVSLDRKVDQSDCRVECLARQCKTLVYLLSSHGHYGHPNALFCLNGIKKKITSKLLLENNDNNLYPLFVACRRGYHKAIKAYMEDVLSGDLDQYEKDILLVGRNSSGLSALFAAMYSGHSEAVKVYVETILSSDMDECQRELFVSKKTDSNTGGLTMAFSCGHCKVIKVYMDAILKSDLNEKRKERILSGKDKNNMSILYVADIMKQTESAKVYREIISGSQLSQYVKDRLLLKNQRGQNQRCQSH